MKVLKKAEEYKWSRKVKCPNCKAELLVEKDDISYWYYYDREWSESDEYYRYQCPECNCYNDMNENSLPAKVKSIAYSKYLESKNRG